MHSSDLPADLSPAVLYERTMPYGPVVRVRRVSAAGVSPVVAVLEVDRRASAPRRDDTGGGTPPALLTIEATSEAEAVEQLRERADSDALIARLLWEKGLR